MYAFIIEREGGRDYIEIWALPEEQRSTDYHRRHSWWRTTNIWTILLFFYRFTKQSQSLSFTANPSSERERRINASASTCFRESEKCAWEREKFNWRLTHGGSSVGGGKWYGLPGPISSIRLTPVRRFRHQDRVSVRAIFSTTESQRQLSSPFHVFAWF